MRMAALNTQRLRAVDAVRSSDNGAHCNESPESVACGGVSSSSYIYLIEWVCQGCDCGQCPSHSNNGLRLLRYNDKITQWDNSYR